MLKNHNSTFLFKLRDRKGQVALFVALIFQVLFLFFAMVINVGLLVHHKINLQNSVDLAAYYGAAKQAEDLNAIGHMNYQIRQSWKLLAWRYRMLGSAGESIYHPYLKSTAQLRTALAVEGVSSSGPMVNMQDAPAFCITYIPFQPMPKDENTCKFMAEQSSISLFRAPKVFGFLSITRTMKSVSDMLISKALERCRDFGSFNYLMLGKFVVAFKTDQRDRMLVINELAKAMSANEEDFYDLDGESVKVGMQNTFQNNLTVPNRRAVNSFKTYNSLGSAACGKTTDKDRPVKWLSPIKIYPGFSYIDTVCQGNSNGGAIDTVAKELAGDPNSLPAHYTQTAFVSGIEELAQSIGYLSNLNDTFNFSMGVEKNPWCVGYVGASAETQPAIPFSPFGKVTLKARAFFKPFGGRIGPWYRNSWSFRQTDNQYSDGSTIVDPMLPPRPTDPGAVAGTVTDPNNMKTRAANYSRYVGDPYGLKSAQMIGYYGQAIYETSPVWRSSRYQAIYNDPNAGVSKSSPNFADWDALPYKFADSGGSGDQMAWDSISNMPTEMRKLELSAIVPNTFDNAYYSIEPDFYHNYYDRMKKGFISKVGSAVANQFRPDLGYHRGYKAGAINLEEYSVKDQMAEVAQIPDSNLPVKSLFTFTLDDWKHLLTGWSDKNLMDYSLNPNTFGKCDTEPVAGVPNPGNCVVGGSTGFGVKMISSDWLNSKELKLGGEGTSAGRLLNPPPEDF
ncbi:TadE/TadG family type IV pilus assembly protein [Bdellovibrio sp. NC01]|uniref:TadE/TadG family type IV pilus assembly protein n=1 Tax=Bdellovibrio sp. NC01 TaxID=2220073 RepID=UPI00115C442B|nr:Tad domain-containing protein [Bdellovibrio sp. NC01]QDK39442.1 hypothetical protein DOE51_18485 [Bdellovibrio sp. NC01]